MNQLSAWFYKGTILFYFLDFIVRRGCLKSEVTERSRSDICLIINVVSTSLNDRVCFFRHPLLERVFCLIVSAAEFLAFAGFSRAFGRATKVDLFVFVFLFVESAFGTFVVDFLEVGFVEK